MLIFIIENLKLNEPIMWDSKTTSVERKLIQLCTSAQADKVTVAINDTNRKYLAHY